MLKTTFAVVAVALSLGLASPVFADNQYYIPVCTGNDIPMNSACRMGGPQGTPTTPNLTDRTEVPAVSPGANPYVPLGVGN